MQLCFLHGIQSVRQKKIDGLHVMSWRPCWWTGTMGVNFYFYANYVNKFPFVLSTNMAAMKTT